MLDKYCKELVVPVFQGVCNPSVYIWLISFLIIWSAQVSGLTPFVPKFFYQQFHIAINEASLLTGIASFPGVGGGILLGGYVTSQVMERFGSKRVAVAMSLIAVIGSIATFGFHFKCGDWRLAGVTTPYQNR